MRALGRSRIRTCLIAIAPATIALPLVSAPLAIVEYPLPRPNAFPHDPAVARDGTVWYTDQVNSYIGHLDPATGKVTDYATPTPKSGPHGLVVAPDGTVWYTANRVGKIGHLDPATGHIREFTLPAEARDPHTPLLLDGAVWFTVQQSDMYGRLDPRTGDVKTWRVPIAHALPYGMQRAPDGTIWVALFGTNRLGHIDPKSGALDQITLPNDGSRPRRLVVDASGVVWYTDYARSRLGSYDPRTHAAHEWESPGGAHAAPYGIAIAPDGRIFYDESGTGTVVVFDPRTEHADAVKIPTPGAVVRNISVDSARRRVWLALSGVQRLGRIDLQ